MKELFLLDFFRQALAMCIILAFLFGVLSFFVVMRRLSFLGAGISHTAFGGVALGILLGIHPFATSLLFCLAAALLIGMLARQGRISADTGIGIIYSFSMALGVLLVALRKSYTFDLAGYLFGNILGVEAFDLVMVLAIMLLFFLFTLLFFHRILFVTFDPETAAVSGVRSAWLDQALLLFLAAIIVVSIKIVGIVLVSALVVLPASFGALLSRHYRSILAVGILYTLGIMVGGLFLSYALDLPTGATMVVAGTLLLFAVMGLKGLLKAKNR